MKPAELLTDLEKGDRTMEMLRPEIRSNDPLGQPQNDSIDALREAFGPSIADVAQRNFDSALMRQLEGFQRSATEQMLRQQQQAMENSFGQYMMSPSAQPFFRRPW